MFEGWGLVTLIDNQQRVGNVDLVLLFGKPFMRIVSPFQSGDETMFVNMDVVKSFSPLDKAEVREMFQTPQQTQVHIDRII